ncbi:response regulator [Devosia pacifica]|uniref:response regulator n=1 Tax=Devosia pacifica TaxID=1335967 RepID=UPI001FCE5820|nr:response regulator [Devosia pacifica]
MMLTSLKILRRNKEQLVRGSLDKSGKTVLVVEDEPLIALMLEDTLEEHGWHVSSVAMNEADADSYLSKESPDLAVLDVKLGGGTSARLARVCSDRQIATVFVTGLGAEDLPPECSGRPVLQKPFSPEDLLAALKAA